MADKKIDYSVRLDTSNFRKGADDVKASGRDMARSVGQDAAAAGKAVEGIGAGAEAAAAKLSRAQAQISSRITRLTAEAEAGGRNSADYIRRLAELQGVDLGPLEGKLQGLKRAQDAYAASLARTGVSAGQTAAALRQVPAQFTDIFTSLASGQQPLTVLLQQGGQLKDSFGGVGAAAQAMGGYIKGLITPATLAAGAVLALGAGFLAGQREAQAYNAALVLTGNAAGVTADRLAAMATALDAAGASTTGRAAEVLVAIAQGGRVAAADIERFTAAALRMEKAGGPAAEETAKAFAELGKSPFEAAVKLNEVTGSFTGSVLQQIKALEEQGRTVDAARLAQETYATSLNERAPQLLNQLGLVERAWLGIKDAAKGAVDAIKSIGRADTLADQLADVQRRIAQLDASASVGSNAGKRQATFAAERRELEAQLVAISRRLVIEGERAAAQGESVRQAQAEAQWLKESEKFLDKRRQQEIEIAKARELGVTAGRSEAQIEERIAAIRAKYAEKGGSNNSAARERQAEIDLLNKLAGISSTYNEDLERLNALRERGTLSTEAYGEALRALVAQQPFAQAAAKAEADEVRKLAQEQDRARKVREQYAADLDKSVSAVERETEAMRDQLLELTLGKEALAERIALRYEERAAAADSAAIWTAVTEEEAAAYRELAAQLRDAAAARRALTNGQAAAAATEANRKVLSDLERDAQRASDQISQSLTDALLRGFEDGKGFAENFADAVKNLFKSMVLRPVVQAIVQPTANDVLALLGQGQGSTAGGLNASNLSSLLSAAKTGYGYLASSGYLGSNAAYQAAADAALKSSGNFYAGAGSASSSGSFFTSGNFYAMLAAAAYNRGNAEYDAGFTAQQTALRKNQILGEDVIGQSFSKYSVDNVLYELGTKLGMNDRWASILSGATAIGQLLGRGAPQVEGRNIVGTIGSGGFDGTFDVRTREKGGLFRSDRVTTTSNVLSSDIDRAIDESTAALREQAKKYGAALGLPVEQIDSLVRSFNVDVTFASDAEAVERIKAELEAYGNSLLETFAPAVKDFSQLGESTADTITRLSGNLLSVNEVLAQLGQAQLATSLAGGAAAQDLIGRFGDANALAQAAGSYFDAYYTEAERAALATTSLNKALAEVGLTAPTSREAYRQLVEAQDLNTEAGRKAYATLLQLAPTFAGLVDATEDLGGSAALTAKQVAEAAERMAEAGRQALAQLANDKGALQVDLLRAQGRGSEADALQRQRDLAAIIEGLSATDVAAVTAAYDYNAALRAQIAALNAATAAEVDRQQRVAAVAAERAGIETQLLQLQGDTATLRARELEALDPSNRSIMERIYALQDLQAAEQAAAQAQAEAARVAEQAAAELVQAEARRLNEREGLETRLLQLQGDTATLRARELEALDPSNRSIMERIYALADEQAAQQAAATAAQQAAAAMQQVQSALDNLGSQRVDLEAQLLTLQGRGPEALALQRERDLAQLTAGMSEADAARVAAAYDYNAALREQIEQTQAANEAAQQAAQAQQALRQSLQQVVDGIFGEAQRVRALITGSTPQSLAQQQAQFAVLTAQARAGSVDAAKALPAASQQLLQLAQEQADSLLDVQRLRAQVADSLEGTGGAIAARNGLTVPVALPPASEAAFSATASNTAALVAEVASLREANAAQASSLAALNLRFVQLLERWEVDGMPETRTTA